MAFKMKGSPMKRNFGIGASPVKKEGVASKTKLTPKEIEARKKRKANMKAIRDANPDDFELRKHGMPGEAKGGTWTHKKSGKTMKDYYDTGETLSTVEVKGKKSPATKKKGATLPSDAAKIDYKNMTKAQVRAAVIAQNRKGPKTSISMSHAMRMHRMAQK